MFANTPKPPYYAVIFTSKRSLNNEGYEEMNVYLDEIVKKEEGYIGNEWVRAEDGFGIHISYWHTIESIKKWQTNDKHSQAKQTGKEQWYDKYQVRIAKVEKQY